MKYKYFVVEGQGQFPFDMLRYDHCWPASAEDVSAMGADGQRSVTLVTYKENGHIAPTRARWHSFLWLVGDAFDSSGARHSKNYVEAGKGEFSGQFRVVWGGVVLAPMFNSAGAAQAYLAGLSGGTRQPEYRVPA